MITNSIVGDSVMHDELLEQMKNWRVKNATTNKKTYPAGRVPKAVRAESSVTATKKRTIEDDFRFQVKFLDMKRLVSSSSLNYKWRCFISHSAVRCARSGYHRPAGQSFAPMDMVGNPTPRRFHDLQFDHCETWFMAFGSQASKVRWPYGEGTFGHIASCKGRW